MVPDLPANPLSIELTTAHRRLWWQVDDEDQQPATWHASADVWQLEVCPDECRHVGDVELAMADFTPERNLLDSIVVGEWAMEFLAETVLEPSLGRLHPELDELLDPGPPRMLVIRRIELAEPWRGHGLGAALLGSVVRIFGPDIRLAACRVSQLDFQLPGQDRITAELHAVRAARMLERIGFVPWRGVHVVGPTHPALLDARTELLDRWTPEPHEDLP